MWAVRIARSLTFSVKATRREIATNDVVPIMGSRSA